LILIGENAAFSQGLPSPTLDLIYSKGVQALNEGRYDDAVKDLLQAESLQPPSDPRQSDLQYDLGLALFRLERYRDAVPRFLRAARSPSLEAKAHYFAGLALVRQGRMAEARAELEKVGPGSDSSEVAAPAHELIQTISAGPEKKRLSLKASIGLQYDSNVILLPDDASTPSGISNRRDYRAVGALQAGLQLIRSVRWDGGMDYHFYQSLHRDLDRYNIQIHDIGLKVIHQPSLRPYRFDFLYRFADVRVDQTDYLRSHTLGWGMDVLEGTTHRTRLEYRYRNKDFIQTELFPGQNERSGINHAVGLTQDYFFAGQQGDLSVGYTFDRDITRGDDWDYQGHRFLLGLIAPPAWIGGWAQPSVTAEAVVRPYGNSSSLSSATQPEKRKDTIQIYAVNVSRAITPRLSGTVQYLYNINASNLDAFAYHRQVASVYLTAAY
jgi:hypothetical protein